MGLLKAFLWIPKGFEWILTGFGKHLGTQVSESVELAWFWIGGGIVAVEESRW